MHLNSKWRNENTLAITFLLLLMASSAYSKTYYVATTGSDNNPGTHALPWRSIERGDQLGILRPGDVVAVGPGKYIGAPQPPLPKAVGVCLTSCSGCKKSPITYRGYRRAIVDHTGISEAVRGITIGSTLHYVVIDGFEVTGCQFGINLDGIPGASCHDITVANCVVYGLRPKVPDSLDASESMSAGILSNFATDCTIHHNTVYRIGVADLIPSNLLHSNNSAYCIGGAGGKGLKIHNNTLDRSGAGINFYLVESLSLSIKNNVITNMWSYGIFYCNPHDPPVCACNVLHGNAMNYSMYARGSVGDIIADPHYVNVSASDYHLEPDSPLINAGMDVGLAFNGSAPDIGAYETRVLAKQSLISGKVVVNGFRNRPNMPAVGASVILDKGAVDTVVAVDGRYSMPCAPGSHEMRLRYLGAAPRYAKMRLNSGATTTKNFSMTLRAGSGMIYWMLAGTILSAAALLVTFRRVFL